MVSRWGSSERTCSHTLRLRLPWTAAREQSPIQPVQGGRRHGGQPAFPGGRKSQLRDGRRVGAGPAPPSPHPSAPLPGGQGSPGARERGLPGGVTDPRHTASPQHPAPESPVGGGLEDREAAVGFPRTPLFLPHGDPGLRAGDSREVSAKFQARQASLSYSKGVARGIERAGTVPGLSCWVTGGSLLGTAGTWV